MNKSELVDAIASGAGLSKADAARALDATTGAIHGALKKGDRVSLVGFGSFSVSRRAARDGRQRHLHRTQPALFRQALQIGRMLPDERRRQADDQDHESR